LLDPPPASATPQALRAGKIPNNETMEQWNNNKNEQKDIEELIEKLNKDESIHGIIIQRPLPKPYDEDQLQSLIDPKKDIDGLSINSPFQNPLVLAVSHVINHVLSVGAEHVQPNPIADWEPRAQHVVPPQLKMAVIGKGISGGKPIYEYFLKNPVITIPVVETRNCASLRKNKENEKGNEIQLNVQQVDTSTKNPTEILKSADIIISCVGKDRIVNKDNIKKGVILVSVGQHLNLIRRGAVFAPLGGETPPLQKWTGDYDEQEIAPLASFYTTTPGGIGPLNVIFLLQNVISATSST